MLESFSATGKKLFTVLAASPSGAKMTSSLSCSLLVLGKSSDGVMSIWIRCGNNFFLYNCTM